MGGPQGAAVEEEDGELPLELQDGGEELEDAPQPKERRKLKKTDGRGVKRSRAEKDKEKGSGGSRGSKRGEQEMWEKVVAQGDSEEDVEGQRTAEDDAFINDEGAQPAAELYGSDEDGQNVTDLPQAEEDDEVAQLFKKGRKRKQEKSAAEKELDAEEKLAMLERAAEEDAEANRQGKPAINKLRMLPFLKEQLQRKNMQQEFLDRGVLTTLKNWLEPLPSGALPNIQIRAAVLSILKELPIDLGNYDLRETLKATGLGKSIMFFARLPEETLANKKLARDIMDIWSRPIFQKSTRYEDLREEEEERAYMEKPVKRSEETAQNNAENVDDLELDSQSREPGPLEKGYRQHARIPQPLALDFVKRPKSKISEEAAANRRNVKDDRHYKMTQRLQKLSGSKTKTLRAEKVSVEGRGLVKYI